MTITETSLAQLSVGRYRLILQARQACSLPAFLGSTLRGAFGIALKNTVCVINHRECERCLVASKCIYPYVFETPAPVDLTLLRGQQQAPHPFILCPPMPDSLLYNQPQKMATEERWPVKVGQDLAFNLLLMGRAIDYLPYIIYTVSQMAERGLGVDRARFELTNVSMLDVNDQPISIYAKGELAAVAQPSHSLAEIVAAHQRQPDQSDKLTLRFITPARIRVEGDLQTKFSFSLLVRSLLRRWSLLTALYGQNPLQLNFGEIIAQAEAITIAQSQLHWWDVSRYSNRQQAKLKIGGFIGEITYQGDIAPFVPLVRVGEWLHIGSGTSFGLGKYQIVAA